jgi:hypothetical protein
VPPSSSSLSDSLFFFNTKLLSLTFLFPSRGAHVELFSPPPKPSGCDFKQWIDNYMIVKDKEYVAWVKKCGSMRKGASSSK